VLARLERHYGPLQVEWPVEPYEFLIWWHCGYPPSDAACGKGWAALQKQIGTTPKELLAATPARIAAALRAGGLVPELRALRLKQIAARVQDEFGGDLRAALAGPLERARTLLKKFPAVADPGADRILLFGELAPVAAVPSNCPHVLVRIVQGRESENYRANYRDAQALVGAQVPARFDARMRAYLLLKRHGQEICKRSKPKCRQCPVQDSCAYVA